MYSIMLVDDEKGIVEGLSVIIKRDLSNCQVIGCAYDGIDGFNLSLELQPDIIITDIRMLQRDGLDMIQMLLSEGLNAKFIILSGYSEFEYAKRGIELKVNFYLNKPVEEEELYYCVNKAISEIEMERVQMEEIQGLKKKVASNLETFKEFVLRDILDAGSANIKDIAYLLDSIGLSLPTDSPYICAIIEINGSDGKQLQDEEFRRIQYIINTQLNDYAEVHILRYLEAHMVIMISNRTLVAYSQLIHSLESIKNTIMQKLQIPLTLGIGLPHTNIDGIHKSFEEAKHALNYKLIKGNHTIIQYDEIKKDSTHTFVIKEEDINHLEASIQSMNFEACKLIIDDIFKKIASHKNLSWSDLQLQCLGILLTGILRISPLQIQLNEFIGQDILSLEAISRFKTLDQLNGWLRTAIQKLIELKSISHIPLKNDIISEIKEYVAENFDKNITLAELSSRFYINLHYLSQLFKEKTGQTYLHYLMQLRVNRSKELLEKSELKVYEICQLVGYTDATYFSKLFEKFVGCRPSVYRKKFSKSDLS